MGNVNAAPVVDNGGDLHAQDLDWIGVPTQLLFDSNFVMEKVKDKDVQALDDAGALDESNDDAAAGGPSAAEESISLRLVEIFRAAQAAGAQGKVPVVDNFPELGFSESTKTAYSKGEAMREVVLKRLHLALLREQERTKGDAGGEEEEKEDVATAGGQAGGGATSADPKALLTSLSLQMTLTVAQSVQATNPALFTALCQGLLTTLQASAPQVFARAGAAEKAALASIKGFASDMLAAGGASAASAVGLLLALATCTASVSDMLAVVEPLLSLGAGASLDAAVAPFLQRLTEQAVKLPLSSPHPTERHGSLKLGRVQAAPPRHEGFAALAADGVHLFAWDKRGIAKCGTGFHGTIAGNVYAENTSLTTVSGASREDVGYHLAGSATHESAEVGQPEEGQEADANFGGEVTAAFGAAEARFRLKGVRIWHSDQHIGGLQQLLEVDGEDKEMEARLGYDLPEENTIVDLDVGEYITAVQVYADEFVRSIAFQTNRGRSTHCGQDEGSMTVFEAPEGSAVCAFHGSTGAQLRTLKVHWARIVSDEPNPASLAFVPGGGLYFASTAGVDQPLTVRALNASSLEVEGDAMVLAEAHVGEPCGAEEGADSETRVAFVSMTSDGRYLYVVTQGAADKLALHTYDPLSGMSPVGAPVTLDWSAERKLLRHASFICNGEQLVALVPQSSASADNADAPYKHYTADVRSGALVDSCVKDVVYDNKAFVPTATAYDVRNNMLWSVDSSFDFVARWRNAGLAPRREAPADTQGACPVSPEARLASLAGRDSLQATMAAALILGHLDRLGSFYGPADEPMADSKAKNYIIVESAGYEDGNSCSLAIGGNDVAKHRRGVNVATLDDNYDVIKTETFDTFGSSERSQALAEFLEDVPTGTLVLMAVMDASSDGDSLAPALPAIKALGSTLVDKVKHRDSFALIARKGMPSSIIEKRNSCKAGPARVEMRLPPVNVPFCVDISAGTFSSLCRIVQAHKDCMGNAGADPVRTHVLLSAMRILRVNAHHLSRGSNRDAFAEADREALKTLLLSWVDLERSALSAEDQSVLGEALRLFIACVDLLYPAPKDRSDLLANYLQQYTNNELSESEAVVLDRLLARMSDARSLAKLLDGASPIALLESLVGISVAETTAALAAGGEGGAAGGDGSSSKLGMLEMLCKQMLSKTAQAVVLRAVQSDTTDPSVRGLAHGLVARFQFAVADAAGFDSSSATSSAHTATVVDASVDADGERLHALRFAGTPQAGMSVPFARDFATQATSVSMWVQTRTPQVTLVRQGQVALALTNGQICARLAGSEITTTTSVNDGKWHHVVLGWSLNSGEAKIYVDGEVAGQGSHGAAREEEPFQFCPSLPNNNFAGALAEVQIYDDMMSDDEAGLNYSSFKDLRRAEAASGELPEVVDLVQIVAMLANSCATVLERAVEAATASGASELPPAIEDVVKASLVSSLWPFVSTCLGMLASKHAGVMGAPLGQLTQPIMALMRPVRALLDLVPADKHTVVAAAPTKETVTKVMESAHPYDCNVNQFMDLVVPGATKIVITFDEETRTEHSYDYVRIWKNSDRTETWHPTIEKYSGVGDNRNFPGVNNQPPLEIPGDTACIEWHTDGSNVDWGWRFTAKAEVTRRSQAVMMHWLVRLDQMTSSLGATLASGLIGAAKVSPEERRNGKFLEDELFAGGINEVEAAQQAFVDELVDNTGAAATLVSKMRSAVAEDQGNLEPVNRAVRATIAAVLAHSGLMAEAIAVASGQREQPSEGLTKAWRSGQKMRQWFDYGDVAQSAAMAAALSGASERAPPLLERGPSLFAGADGRVVQGASDAAVARAKLLVRFARPSSGGAAAGPPSPSKKRWGLLAKFAGARSSSERRLSGKFAGVVDQASSADRLKAQFEYRRAVANRRKQAPSKTDRVLQFVQSNAPVDKLLQVVEERDARCAARAAGLGLIQELVLAAATPSARSLVLQTGAVALRNARLAVAAAARAGGGDDDEEGAVESAEPAHYLAGVHGCSADKGQALIAAFGATLSSYVTLLEETIASKPKGKGGDETRRNLIITVLKALCLDYSANDHDVLLEAGVLRPLRRLLNSRDEQIKAAAWGVMRLLLPRCVATADAGESNEASNLEAQLEEILIDELELMCASSASLAMQRSIVSEATLEEAAEAAAAESAAAAAGGPAGDDGLGARTRLVDGTMQLRDDQPGMVAPHRPVTLTHSFSAWVYRPKTEVELSGGRKQEQGEIAVGDRVRRGSDWAHGDQDGGAGGLGTVTDVDSYAGNANQGVRVQWDFQTSPAAQQYRWGVNDVVRDSDPEERRPHYDLCLVEEGVGGVLFFKGNDAALTEEEAAVVWSSFGATLEDDLTIQYNINAGENQVKRIKGTTRVAPEQWTHLAVTVDQRDVTIYINGEVDARGKLNAALLSPGKAAPALQRVIESAHPYENNMDQQFVIEVPRATSYRVVFDNASRTERSYDFVTFYKDETRAERWGLDKYHGGRGGGERTFPGLDGLDPLDIPAGRFVVHWRTDGSNVDWGFKMTVTATVEDDDDDGSESKAAEATPVNLFPFYFGQASNVATFKRAARGCIANVDLFDRALSADEVGALSTFRQRPARPSFPPEQSAVALLALMKDCCRTTVGARKFASARVMGPLLQLLQRPPFSAQVGVLRLLQHLLPHASVELVDSQMERVNPGSGSLCRSLLASAGAALTMKAHSGDSAIASGLASLTLANEQISLLRSMADSPMWAAELAANVEHAFAGFSSLAEALETAAAAVARPGAQDDAAALPSSAMVTGALAVFGGAGQGVGLGSRIMCRRGESDEEGTVVGLGWPVAPDEKKEAEPGGLGDSFQVVLDASPDEVAVVPADDVSPHLVALSDAVHALAARVAESLVPALQRGITVDASDKRTQYKSKTIGGEQTEEFESPHPYQDNMDLYFPFECKGAKELIITFDGQSRTEANCDFVRLYKDESHTDFYGENKYHGRDGNENWPGCGGRAPLKVQGSKVVIHFHSDCSNTDWGFKCTVTGSSVETLHPPVRPPLSPNVALQDLHAHSSRALSMLLARPAFVSRAMGMLPALVSSAIGTAGGADEGPRKVKPTIVESKHDYDNNTHQIIPVTIKGAKSISISFDPQTKTESGCDYVRFYKDASMGEMHGLGDYCGGRGGSSSNWPGMQGRPPLVIPSDSFVILWHTDGSCVDWGWKMFCTPEMAGGAEVGGVLEADMKLNGLLQLVREGHAKMDPVHPREFARFEAIKTSAAGAAGAAGDAAGAADDAVVDLSSIELLPESDDEGEEESKQAGGRAGTWPRTFVASNEGGDSADVRKAASTEGDVIGAIAAGQTVEATAAQGDWLRISFEDAPEAWVLRRAGDVFYFTPEGAAAEANNLVTIYQEDDDDAAPAAAGGASDGGAGGALELADGTSGGGAASDSSVVTVYGFNLADDVRGNMRSIDAIAYRSLQSASKTYARSAVITVVQSWPADVPFRTDTFGSFTQFVQFLKLTFDAESSTENSAALGVLRGKIQELVRSSDEASQGFVTALVGFAIRELQQAVSTVLPPLPSKALVKSAETPHPYRDNMDENYLVHIPGAKRIKVVFTEETRTENSCDWVRLYSDENQNNAVSPQFTGGRNNSSDRNFAGLDGRPPVFVEGDRFYAHFHSDGSNTDWGFKLMAYGIVEEPSDEEIKAHKAKKKALEEAPEAATGLACWLLELLAKEPSAAAGTPLYAPATIRTLRSFLKKMPADQLTRVVHLVTCMVQERERLAAANAMEEVASLAALLTKQLKTRYDEEQAAGSSKGPSAHLQALVQAAVALQHALPSEAGGAGAREVEALVWGGIGKQMSVSEGGAAVAKDGSSDNGVTVAAAGGYSGGKHSWTLSMRTMSNNNVAMGVVGVGSAGLDLDQRLGLSGVAMCWDVEKEEIVVRLEDGAVHAAGYSGVKVREGDEVRVELDMSKKTLGFYRNQAFVGVAVGTRGSGAAVVLDDAQWPAVLTPAVSLTQQNDACAIRSLSSAAAAATVQDMPWFDDVCTAVSLLSDFNANRVPTKLLREEFIPTLVEKTSVVIESAHPFDMQAVSRQVTIPGATSLAVQFDGQTHLGASDIIRVSAPNNETREIAGLEGAMEDRPDNQISVGDRVVRGPDWDYELQDGGPGCYGEVLELVTWKNKPNAGVRVRWEDSEETNVYRYNHDGCWDLIVVGHSQKSRTPIKVTGDTLTFELAPEHAITADNAGEWRGSLALAGAGSSLTMPEGVSDMEGDFTVEMWFRATHAAMDAGVPHTLVTRGPDEEGSEELTQFSLFVAADGALMFLMGNGASEGVSLRGGEVTPDTWFHAAVTMSGTTVSLYQNGALVDSGSFSGQRLPAMGAPIRVGRSAADFSAWEGQIYDLRVWAGPRSAAQIEEAQHTLDEQTGSGEASYTATLSQGGIFTVGVPLPYAGGAAGGVVYYEATVMADSMMRIGWTNDMWTGNPEGNLLLGSSDGSSWALESTEDGVSAVVNDDHAELGVGERPRLPVGAVLGFALDTASGAMTVTLDGEDLGFNQTCGLVDGMMPAATLFDNSSVDFNFGQKEFAHAPAGAVPVLQAARPEAASQLAGLVVWEEDGGGWVPARADHGVCRVPVTLAGRWVMNDGAAAAQLASTVPGVAPIALAGCEWTADVWQPSFSSTSFGFKCTIVPTFDPTSVAEHPQFAAFAERFAGITPRHDAAIVRAVNEAAKKKGMEAEQLMRCSWSDVAPERMESVLAELVESKEETEVSESKGDEGSNEGKLEVRFKLLQAFNRVLAPTIALIDLSLTDRPWSLVSLLTSCRSLIFRALKDAMWQRALDTTAGSGGGFELRLSRSRAAAHADSPDVEGRWSVFSQAMRQMNAISAAQLRGHGKLYTCTFMGERSHDAGGPYRESFAMYASELESNRLPLLTLCANGRGAVGQNRERYVLNSSATTPTLLQMFEFFGKLIGIAIRTREFLAINLAGIVWKGLVGQQATIDDLEGVDVSLVNSMKSLRNIHEQGITDQDTFEACIFETFSTLNSNDDTVELRPGGAEEAVTFDNRGEFADMVEQFRLHEFDRQIAAMRRGLATIVPIRLLSLFTWQELEIAACGSPDFDVALLQSVTEYSGCSAQDAHVQYFWEAMNSFTNEQRSAVLRFVWGRSRLPISSASFSQRFKLQPNSGSPPDSYYPVAHTCFFSLELPRYSTVEIMKTRLLYAATNCIAIDGDETGVGMAAAAMGWES